jgi:hypothetical protein
VGLCTVTSGVPTFQACIGGPTIDTSVGDHRRGRVWDGVRLEHMKRDGRRNGPIPRSKGNYSHPHQFVSDKSPQSWDHKPRSICSGRIVLLERDDVRKMQPYN